jgi:hypothetical protein
MSEPTGYADFREQNFRSKSVERKLGQQQNMTHLLRAASHAEVEFNKLAHGNEWQKYQQLLQGAINHASSERAKIGPKMMDPALTEHGDLLALKMEGIMLTERIESLTMALELPKIIQEDGAKARKLLEESDWLRTDQSED